MSDLCDTRRTIGCTDLKLPRIVFGTAALGNVGRVLTDRAKLALCDAFLRQVASPVWIDTAWSHGAGMAIEVLGRMLRQLDVDRNEVVIQLTVDARDSQSIAACWEMSCRLLGDDFRPRLVATDRVDDDSLQFVRDLLAAKAIRGVGLVAADWQQASQLLSKYDPDWVMLGGCTVMRHPLSALAFLSGLAANHKPIVLSGVFEGGFLVGGNRWDGRSLQAEELSDRSLLAWRKSFVALCDGHGISPTDVCIQFALAMPSVFAVRLETAYADRVSQNVAAIGHRVPVGFWQSMIEEGLLAEGEITMRLSAT